MAKDWIERGEEPICYGCIHRVATERGIGCEHPYLYTKDGELIESRNNTISNNISKNKCNKREAIK